MKPHNICFVMKVVEHRTTELIFEKGYLEVRKSVEIDGNPLPKKPALWVQGQKPPPQGGPFKPQVHITGRVDAEQDEEDNETKAWMERPMYYAEMRDGLIGKDVALPGPTSSQATVDDLSIAPSVAEIDDTDLDNSDYPSVFAKSMKAREEKLAREEGQSGEDGEPSGGHTEGDTDTGGVEDSSDAVQDEGSSDPAPEPAAPPEPAAEPEPAPESEGEEEDE